MALMLVAAMVVGGLATYVKMSPAARAVPPDLRRSDTPASVRDRDTNPTRDEEPAPRTEAAPKPKPAPTDDSLRIPVVNGMDVKLGEAAPPMPDDQDPKVFLATQTMAAAQFGKARALNVTVAGRNAVLDFNSELESGMGSSQEGEVVKAMQVAMGQFKDIDTFQFRVEGHLLDSLGSLDLSQPIPVIRPDGKEAIPAKPITP